MSLNYQQIQAEVKRLRFTTGAQDNSIPLWINQVQAEVWALERWRFRHAEATLTITGGSRDLAGEPAGTPIGLWLDVDGTRLEYLERRRFNTVYLGDTSTGTPAHWSVLNGQVKVAPTPTASGTATLEHWAPVTDLDEDDDVSLLPAGLQYGLLVLGTIRYGQKLLSDFTFQFAEDGYQQALAAMRAEYLDDQEGESTVWGDAYGDELAGNLG